MNKYGLDENYFKRELNKILIEIDCYTPEGMFRALRRISAVADHQAEIQSGERSKA